MKKSKYNIIKQLDNNQFLIFNTFNCSMSIVEKYSDLIHFKDYYTNIDELDYLNNIRIENEIDEKYAHYTIFTTTLCNARCNYCFEQGYKKGNLNKKNANNIINFIKERSINNNRIHIQFFGGEPLLNFDIICYISSIIKEYCDSKNIKYTSNIVTNGSLLNSKIINKIKELNINNIQITLDGTKDRYELIKKYPSNKITYDYVISNIVSCLENNIFVSIRINFDKNNFNDIINLIDNLKYLNKYKNLYIYCMPIYNNSLNSDSIISSHELDKYYSIIFDTLLKNKFIRNAKYFNLSKTSSFCQATKRNTFVFNIDGEIYKCTHMMNNPLGNASEYLVDNKRNNLYSNSILDNKCNKCIFLPLCQGGCISKEIQNGCSSDCYIYSDCFNSVLNTILKLNNLDYKIKE